MGNILSDKSPSSPTIPFTEEVGHPGFEEEQGTVKQKRKRSQDDRDRPDCLGTIVEFLSPKKFPEEDEQVYKAYFTRQRRGTLTTMVAFGLLFSLVVLVLYAYGNNLTPLGVMSVFVIINLILFCLANFKLISDWTLDYVMPYLIWFTLALQLFCDLLLSNTPPTPSDGVTWQIFFIFASYTMLPLQVLHIFLLSSLTTLLHCIFVGVLHDSPSDFVMAQIIANVLLFSTAMLLGSFVYKFLDRKHRRAFLETKASLDTKWSMQEQMQQQQDLLQSVLPKHVADEVMKDFGRENTGQFSKIYIRRHENVSILFADIVGFTAMSSKLTAPELVKTLNALFANFDKLSEKHNQLRIKILGDCYYCICGVPDERPDHAVCCVSMGLDMVIAIRKVREETQSGVDMRVGIHTGAVLAGVMGKRMWQFDVWSKDVKMANNMESGGIPGRVHISEVTYSFIDDEYEVEPGEGEKRSDYIRSSGLKTYLIKIPNKEPDEDLYANKNIEKTPVDVPEETDDTVGESVDSNRNLTEVNHGEVQFAEPSCPSNPVPSCQDRSNQDEFNLLMGKEIDGDWKKQTSSATMRFTNAEMESNFQQERDRQGALSLSCSMVVVLAAFAVQCLMLPKTTEAFITFFTSFILMFIFSCISMATVFPGLFPVPIVRFSDTMNRNPWLRMSWVLTAIFILAASDVVDMSFCKLYNDTGSVPPGQNGSELAMFDPSQGCIYFRYFEYNTVLILINLTVLVKITHVPKFLATVVILTAHCLMNLLFKDDLYEAYDELHRGEMINLVPSKWTITLQLIVVGFALAYLNRDLEKTSRILHFSKHIAKSQNQEVETLKIRNEQLVLNIMPAHVARHFMGSKKRDEELYSQNYKEVGVMFASIPNFADFYSEDAINNQGTECLRVLNEIFSDFDQLLDDRRFQNIHKIKTISSTYMAASGLFPEPEKIKYENEKARWQHLADLTEFAFALKDTLDSINQQSFNNFLLRIGINFGPVLAGVIGARKPHYDIWANAVNVASRMESTGKAGSIQVVEETMVLLRDLYGYKFEQRGLIKVKGKGELMTYFLVGRPDPTTELPNMIQ